jgi:hypothetical protein
MRRKNKSLAREIRVMSQENKEELIHTRKLCARLTQQLAEFEERRALQSADFYARYESGEMGDATDLVEWSATVEMLANAEKRLALLEQANLKTKL